MPVVVTVGSAQHVDMVVVVSSVVAVSTEVVGLAEHNEATKQEDDGRESEHRLDVLIGIVAASEGVRSLQCYDINEGPAKDHKGHKTDELCEGEPGRVDDNTIVPVGVQLGLGVDLRHVLVNHEE